MSSVVAAGPRPGLKPLTAWSRAVYVTLALVIAADVYSLVTGIQLYGMWADVARGGWVADSVRQYPGVESRYAWSATGQANTLVVCAVVFIVWFHRVRRNAGLLTPDGHSKASGWAIWGWIVPVVWWWFPRRIALDSWQASTPYAGDAPRSSGSGVVNLWWAAWLATQFLGQFAGRAYGRAEEPDAIREALRMLNGCDIVDILAALLAIVFVHRLTTLQQHTMDHLPTTPPLSPQPQP
ncbi:DUF4328 domain-containing protein [Streptomyces sp. PKU-EA00015]|uniref:DUF4328 domain-containing protein n=1 Tax=Streptomyces sp. PKU-EA00015 TaxID=2748326 RepID=UPI0015A0BD63|nr:DUF4328 domain-containing protein [Streptomyces sp. PKU-EA00015]NWF28703.1 DUF4328 domain-containing protein [Streptomyces sp. PKU-EA00015]